MQPLSFTNRRSASRSAIAFVAIVALVRPTAVVLSDDCDGDGVDDAVAIADGTAADCDANGIPDGCEAISESGFPFVDVYAVPSAARALDLADLDGDGWLDIAVTAGADNVTILRNDGTGRFEPGTDYRIGAGTTPRQIFLRDLDADSDVDMLIGAGNRISVLLNRGDGTFEEPTVFGEVDHGIRVRPADLDGDGLPEIIVWPLRDPQSFSVYHNEGSAEFVEVTTIPAVGLNFLAVGRIDEDERADVAVTTVEGLLVCFGQEKGELLSAASIPSTEVFSVVATGEFDGDQDGTTDLAAETDDEIVLFSNRGGRVFERTATSPVATNDDVASFDLDGSGSDDLLGLDTETNTLTIGLNDGYGRFLFKKYDAGSDPGQITAADVDRDGVLEIVAARAPTDRDNSVIVVRSLGSGRFALPRRVFSTASPSFLLAEDLDLDGRSDLSLMRDGPYSSVGLLARGGGGFEVGSELALSDRPTSTAAADVDGDGAIDLVVATDVSAFLEVLVNFGGTFEVGAPVFVTEGQRAVAAADFDGDGDDDLAVSVDSPGRLSLALNEGAGVFVAIQPAMSIDPHYESLLAGEFAGDDHVDLLGLSVLSDGGRLTVLRNDGDAAFTIAESVSLPASPRTMVVADFDADGALDVAVSCGSTNTVEIVLADQNGGFRDRRSVAVGKEPRGIAVADFDGDEALDLAVGNEGADTLSILLGDGAGSFRQDGEVVVGRRPSFLAAADLDGDGLTDLALTTENGVSIVAKSRGSSEPSVDCDANGVPDECELSTRDCNANGQLDECDVRTAVSEDVDGDGVPDECVRPELYPRFHRGDPNADGGADVSDALFLFGFLFLGGPASECTESADVNNDRTIDLSDGITLLNFLFLGGPAPPAPGPPAEDCERDADAPGSSGDLGCEAYLPCEADA